MAAGNTVKYNKYQAQIADKNAYCAFCNRNIDEETIYGKLYSIGDIHCHYYCVLLSCCLIQRGKDHEGLLGFMYPDILAEIQRSKKHRCSYCGINGASLGCSIVQCKKQFHLPCGREKNAVSLFCGNYKTFCEKHAPKQKVPDLIMSKAKVRLARARKAIKEKSSKNSKTSNKATDNVIECADEPECVCVICYEAVDGFPSTQTFWPSCCARDAWYHRSCLQRMALSAGSHYLKCPLCNDKDTFSTAVLNQGYHIPNRDAAWELEQNAFAGIYERAVVCRADDCRCQRGREYDADSGMWDIKLCVLCGSSGAHFACCVTEYYVCAVCAPAAPDQSHLAVIDAVSLPSQSQSAQRAQSGPIMPSRMSLRRTKQRHILNTSSGSSQNVTIKTDNENVKSNTDLSREDLNLKTPKRPTTIMPTEDTTVANEALSPLKLLKQGLDEKVPPAEVDNIMSDNRILDEMREKFRKPQPLSVRRKIVDHVLEEILHYMSKEKQQTRGSDPTHLPWSDSETLTESIHSIEHKKNGVVIKDFNSDVNISNYPTNDSSYDNNEEPPLRHDVPNPPELVCENANSTLTETEIETDDNSSSSTFQLPPEFMAAESSNSLPVMDSPKNLKKINIESDSMEISEDNQTVNIDLVKVQSDEAADGCKVAEQQLAFKFSPLNEDVSERNLKIDVESFKNQYLNEVDRKFSCKYDLEHAHDEQSPTDLHTDADSASDAVEIPPKRKLPSKDSVACKKSKSGKYVLEHAHDEQSPTQPLTDADSATDVTEIPPKRKLPSKDSVACIKTKSSKYVLEHAHDEQSPTEPLTNAYSAMDVTEIPPKRKLPSKDSVVCKKSKSSKYVLEHTHDEQSSTEPLTDADSASDAVEIPPKRKLPSKDSVACKKSKSSKYVLEHAHDEQSSTEPLTDADSVTDVTEIPPKRKLPSKDSVACKKTKSTKYVLEHAHDEQSPTEPLTDADSATDVTVIPPKRKLPSKDSVACKKTKSSKYTREHAHDEQSPTEPLTDADSASDAGEIPPKRKLPSKDSVACKKTKSSKYNREHAHDEQNPTEPLTDADSASDAGEIPPKRKLPSKTTKKVRKIKTCTANYRVSKERRKKHDTELSIRNKSLRLKIRFKEGGLKLKFTKSGKRTRQVKSNPKVLKQYILQCPHAQAAPAHFIARPDTDVTPIKKKHVKLEKSSDNLKQTSIDSFFKTSPIT